VSHVAHRDFFLASETILYPALCYPLTLERRKVLQATF
jgi:hypothetical protein